MKEKFFLFVCFFVYIRWHFFHLVVVLNFATCVLYLLDEPVLYNLQLIEQTQGTFLFFFVPLLSLFIPFYLIFLCPIVADVVWILCLRLFVWLWSCLVDQVWGLIVLSISAISNRHSRKKTEKVKERRRKK